MSLLLFLATLPSLYWAQPVETAPAFRQAGIERLCVPAETAAAWPPPASRSSPSGRRNDRSGRSCRPRACAPGRGGLRLGTALGVRERLALPAEGGRPLLGRRAGGQGGARRRRGVRVRGGRGAGDRPGRPRGPSAGCWRSCRRCRSRRSPGRRRHRGGGRWLTARRRGPEPDGPTNLLFKVVQKEAPDVALNVRIGSKEFPRKEAQNPEAFAALGAPPADGRAPFAAALRQRGGPRSPRPRRRPRAAAPPQLRRPPDRRPARAPPRELGSGRGPRLRRGADGGRGLAPPTARRSSRSGRSAPTRSSTSAPRTDYWPKNSPTASQRRAEVIPPARRSRRLRPPAPARARASS